MEDLLNSPLHIELQKKRSGFHSLSLDYKGRPLKGNIIVQFCTSNISKICTATILYTNILSIQPFIIILVWLCCYDVWLPVRTHSNSYACPSNHMTRVKIFANALDGGGKCTLNLLLIWHCEDKQILGGVGDMSEGCALLQRHGEMGWHKDCVVQEMHDLEAGNSNTRHQYILGQPSWKAVLH